MGQAGSVAHYTSLEVINSILNEALSSQDATFTLQLSLITMTGDDMEGGRSILSKYFTGSSQKKQLKEEWDNDFYPKNMPFILSTVVVKVYREGGCDGGLLMWKQYGKGGAGALIRFDREKLREYCRGKGYTFAPCRYRNSEDIDSLINIFNRSDTPFTRLLEEVCLAKSFSQLYEQEWRVICYSGRDAIRTKSMSRGIVSYVEVQFPAELIEEICLGPLTDDVTTLESVSLLKDRLSDKFQGRVNFEVTTSKTDYLK